MSVNKLSNFWTAASCRGQEFGLEKPKLCLSTDKGKISIVKGQSWARKGVDPNGLTARFAIKDHVFFESSGWTDQIEKFVLKTYLATPDDVL